MTCTSLCFCICAVTNISRHMDMNAYITFILQIPDTDTHSEKDLQQNLILVERFPYTKETLAARHSLICNIIVW